jgi:HEAT repeat protein
LGPETKLRIGKLPLAVLHEPDPALVAVFLSHPSVRVRESAVGNLERSNSPDAEAYLLEFIGASDDRYLVPRVNARLGKGATTAAVPVLARLIHHRIEDIKASAIDALCMIGDASTTPVFLDALSDRSWVAKAYAMRGLAEHGDLRAMDAVVARLKGALSRERADRVAGDTEVIYALRYLWRWREDARAADAIAFVRRERIARLNARERVWIEDHVTHVIPAR